MDAIGQHVTEVRERVTTRAPRPHETEALNIPAGVPVLVIARTHYAGGTPVETADIIVPGDRYEISWRTPRRLTATDRTVAEARAAASIGSGPSGPLAAHRRASKDAMPPNALILAEREATAALR